jgi:Tol biopolymer transport system component
VDGNTDIWIKEIPEGPFERLTVDDVPETTPTWSRDGVYVFYAKADDAGNYDLWRSRADGTGAPELILDDERSLMDPQVSPDGTWIVLRSGPGGVENNRSPERDVVGFRPGVDTEVVTLVGTPEFVEYAPSLSPDGRWLAYVSDLSGRDEVYVSPFPDVASGRWRVSTEGGVGPLWSRDGTELFFLDTNLGWVSARVEGASELRVLQRTTLFSTDGVYIYTAARNMDVSPEGDRFLMIAVGGEMDALANVTPRFILVQNWFEELRERMRER